MRCPVGEYLLDAIGTRRVCDPNVVNTCPAGFACYYLTGAFATGSQNPYACCPTQEEQQPGDFISVLKLKLLQSLLFKNLALFLW